MENQEALNRLMRSALGDFPLSEFHPFAEYNPAINLLVVVTRDESQLEAYDPQTGVALLRGNYTEEGEDDLIGLAIYHASAFCKRRGLRIDHTLNIHVLLQCVAEEAPHFKSEVVQIINRFEPTATLEPVLELAT